MEHCINERWYLLYQTIKEWRATLIFWSVIVLVEVVMTLMNGY